jgi:FKBP-type peptidyl-prolyl cis-trans isomerase 2
MVRLDYDLWAEGGGRTELVDTTRHEVAQEAKVPDSEGQHWGPRPYVIGGGYFPGAIESALTGVKIGDEFEKEFAPADAFGERDPKLIELFSMHEISRLPEMRREDAHLDVGTILTIDGRRGRVVTVTAARVRVDFNTPFAGRKIRGKFKVIDRISEPAEQVRGIVELQYGRGSEFHIETNEKTISLRIPDRSKFDISWVRAKSTVVDRLRSQLHPETIRIIEEYVTPAPEKAEKKDDAEKPAGAHESHRAHPSPASDAKSEKVEGDQKPTAHESHPHSAAKHEPKAAHSAKAAENDE